MPPKKNLKSSFLLRFPPICRAGKARRAEGACGGNSTRGAQRIPFGYFQTDTASLTSATELGMVSVEVVAARQ